MNCNKINYEIQLTSVCNLNCKHCLMKYNINNENLKKYIDLEKVKSILNRNKENISYVHFSGGEPLLHDNLELLLEILKEFNSIDFIITSNLMYNIDDLKKEIIKNVKYFYTSFDYSIRFSNIKQLFLWYNNLKVLKQLKKDVFVFVTITSDLINNVSPKKLSKFFNDLKIYYVMNPIINIGGVKENNYLIPSIETEYLYLKELLSINDKYNYTKNNIIDKSYFDCEYHSFKNFKIIDTNFDEVFCIKDKNCNIDKILKYKNICIRCKNKKYCNGRCIHTKCIKKYFKDIFDISLKQSIIYK